MDYPSDCNGCPSISLMSANYYHILYQSMVTRWHFTLLTRYLKVKKNYLCRQVVEKMMNLKSWTPSCMFFLETGRFPLSVIIHSGIVTYWAKLLSGPENKIIHILNKYLLTQYDIDIFKNPLIDCMHSIFV